MALLLQEQIFGNRINSWEMWACYCDEVVINLGETEESQFSRYQDITLVINQDQSKIKIHLSDEQSEYIPFSWWAAIPASLVSITSVALSVVWWSIIPSAISAATDWGSGPGATSSAAITVSLQGWARLLMTAHRNIIIKIASNPQNCIFMQKDLL